MKQQIFYYGVEKVEYNFDEADIERILKLYLENTYKVKTSGSWNMDWFDTGSNKDDYNPKLEITLTHKIEKEIEDPDK